LERSARYTQLIGRDDLFEHSYEERGAPEIGWNLGERALLLGNGGGTLQQAISVGAGNAVTVGDFDGDRNPDFALYEQSSSTVQVLLGKGDGTFQSVLSFSWRLRASR
jgi:hypothetical protein